MLALVTGAAGFVGTALCRRLTERGARVRALVRGGSRTEQLGELPGLELQEGDITRPLSLPGAVRGADVVFHLAGIRRASVREEFFHVNADGTRNLCEAMLEAGGTARLVLASSLAACGPSAPEKPRREDEPRTPAEWYGESKAAAERIAFSYVGRLAVAVARPPRILGPGDRENLAFFRLVRRGFLLALRGGPRPLTVADVDDVVTLLLLLAERPEAVGEAFFCAGPTTTLEELQTLAARLLDVRPRTVNLAPGSLKLLAALADVASGLLGRRLPLNRKLARQLIAPAWTCSGEKAEARLGFRPQKPLADSVQESIAWYRQAGLL